MLDYKFIVSDIMGRVEFDTLIQAEEWIKRFVLTSNKKYVGFYTSNNELILTPTKSTRPIIYGYIKTASMSTIRKLFKDTDIQIFSCSNFEWNIEKTASKIE